MAVNFFVNIIESPKDEEIYNNTSEATLLKKVLELNDIKCVSRVAINRNYFFKGVRDGFIEGLEKYNYIPILHISCHGSDNGLRLSCEDEISWDEIKKNLCVLNELLNGSLLLCMSSCKGFSACQMAVQKKNNQNPFFALIGNTNSPTWAETAIAYATFYHLIIKGHTINNAVEIMCKSSDNNDWEAITFLEAQQTYMNYIKQIEPTGLLSSLLQHNNIINCS